jgi:MerR family transcriptional regulator, copper efflux regulator
VRFIREAQSLGFSLREAAELLALQADPAADARAVRQRAAAKIEEVGEKIARLERICGALDALVASCPGSGPLGDCSIMTAMLGDGAGLPSSAKE